MACQPIVDAAPRASAAAAPASAGVELPRRHVSDPEGCRASAGTRPDRSRRGRTGRRELDRRVRPACRRLHGRVARAVPRRPPHERNDHEDDQPPEDDHAEPHAHPGTDTPASAAIPTHHDDSFHTAIGRTVSPCHDNGAGAGCRLPGRFGQDRIKPCRCGLPGLVPPLDLSSGRRVGHTTQAFPIPWMGPSGPTAVGEGHRRLAGKQPSDDDAPGSVCVQFTNPRHPTRRRGRNPAASLTRPGRPTRVDQVVARQLENSIEGLEFRFAFLDQRNRYRIVGVDDLSSFTDLTTGSRASRVSPGHAELMPFGLMRGLYPFLENSTACFESQCQVLCTFLCCPDPFVGLDSFD